MQARTGWRWRSVQARITWLILCTAGAFSALGGALVYQVAFEQAIDSGRSTLVGLVGAVEKTAAIGAYTVDHVLLQEVIDSLGRNPLVARVEVKVDSEQHPLWHRSVDSAPGPASAAAAESAVLDVNRALYSPFDPSERVGMLRVGANNQVLRQVAQRQALTLALLMMSQIALIAVVLHLAAGHLVGKPLKRISRKLVRLAPGTSERVAVPANHASDEIGALIRGTNLLLDATALTLERERALRAKVEALHEQYRKIFDSSSAGIFVLDRQGHLINGNPTLLKVLGLPQADVQALQGQNFLRRAFRYPDRLMAMVEQAIRCQATVSGDFELVLGEPGTHWAHCLISVQTLSVAPDTTVEVIEGVMYDVTERRKTESLVTRQAHTDALTGLANRAACEARLDAFLSHADTPENQLCMLFLDLDGFKQINDQHGHHAGDKVLKACAERMSQVVRRSTDLVARVGGDEFIVLLVNSGPGDPAVTMAANNLMKAVCRPIRLNSRTVVQLGVSIGMACYPLHGVNRRQLVLAADEAMYEVKKTGKNAFAMALPNRTRHDDSGPAPLDKLACAGLQREDTPSFSESMV